MTHDVDDSDFTVTGYKVQRSHHRSYHAGPASCRDKARDYGSDECNHGDWHYDNTAGCGGAVRPVCSRVDDNICPVIDGTKATAYFDEAPRVACTYPQSAFKSARGLREWKKHFGEDEEYDMKIMPTFCSTPSVKCPVDRKNGSKMKSCSRFNDIGDEGKLCRDWMKKFPAEAKRIQEVYCKTYRTADCKMSDSYDSDSSGHHHDRDYDDRRHSRRKDCGKDKDSGFFGGGVFIFFIFLLLIIIIVAAACAGRGRRRG